MSPDDRRLARRLDREARAADRVAARAARLHARAVLRRERVLRQARRGLPVQAAVAATTAVAAVLVNSGWAYVAVGATALAGRSVARLVRPPAVPMLAAAAPRVPPPPPRTSAVWPAVRRLEQVRVALARLVPLVAPVGRDAAEEAWRAVSEADLALRWQAARLAAVEPHRGAEPALLEQLLAGVAAQERVVAGLADLVSASADPLATMRLQDATDALHALAMGLRELR